MVDDHWHSLLHLSTDAFSQNEVGILLKWGSYANYLRGGTGKKSKFWKSMYTERFLKGNTWFFFEHPWRLEMKFLSSG